MRRTKSERPSSSEEIERYLRHGKIVKVEPILSGTAYWGHAEAEFATLVGNETDPKKKEKMNRACRQLALKLKHLSPGERERILLGELNKWKNEV